MSIDGKWNVSMDTPLGRQSFVWELRQAAGVWSGTMTNAKTGASTLTNIQVEGDAVSFATSVSSPMGAIHATFRAAVAGDTVKGTCKTKFGDMAFAGVRA